MKDNLFTIAASAFVVGSYYVLRALGMPPLGALCINVVILGVVGYWFVYVRKSEVTLKTSRKDVPPELHYLIPLADEHGFEARIAKFDPELQRHVLYGETLSEQEIRPLRSLYNEISAKDHCGLINDWYHCRLPKYSDGLTLNTFGLLRLFEQLGDRGIIPFNNGEVRLHEIPITLDWNKLPPGLEYLAEPCSKYGELQFELNIHDFLKNKMTPAERDELRELSKRLKKDEKAIQEWLEEYNVSKHPEAARVHFTDFLIWTGEDLGLL